MLLLAVTAYAGGFLPFHFMRRVDRLAFGANSRNEHTKWRDVIETVTLSLSDQQIVTGLAILIAGYHEMINGNLSIYHWNAIVYLAWMSSSVHIASLTLLRDIFNEQPILRNVRVAGMLILLVLLAIGMWPLRYFDGEQSLAIPARCLWDQKYAPIWQQSGSFGIMDIAVDPNWAISLVMLMGAYIWKLSQLFATSRSCVRTWLAAKPQAVMERSMRRLVLSRRSKWLVRPAKKLLVLCYATSVVYAESAESYAASILYLCLALAWGMVNIFYYRSSVDADVKTGEAKLSFGQLVPLFLLMLPILLVFELHLGENMFGFAVRMRTDRC